MSNKGTTAHPEEVREAFAEYAGLLDIYANDQLAMITRYHTNREKKAAQIKAEVYNSIAIEMRSIEWSKE